MRNQHLEDLVESLKKKPSGPKFEALSLGIKVLMERGADVSEYKAIYMDLRDSYMERLKK